MTSSAKIRKVELGRALLSGVSAGDGLRLRILGHCYLIGGRVDDAQRLTDQALALAREWGERGEEASTLATQGEIALRRAPGVAAERYRQALALAEELGMRPVMAHCHAGLARCGGGEGHQERATELYREMQMVPRLSSVEARGHVGT